MIIDQLVKELGDTLRYFQRSTSIFEESDANFKPSGESYTVAQQMAHIAVVTRWFAKCTFAESWDLDFEKHDAETRSVNSVRAAQQLVQEAFDHARDVFSSKSEEQLEAAFPADDPIMPGAPRKAAVFGIVDHTAHHRGALTVYARLLGKVPPMPYM